MKSKSAIAVQTIPCEKGLDVPVVAVDTQSDILIPEKYLTKPEVAARLRKTTRTIDSWMARGILPYIKIGRSVLFDWEDCERHLAQHFRISPFNT